MCVEGDTATADLSGKANADDGVRKILQNTFNEVNEKTPSSLASTELKTNEVAVLKCVLCKVNFQEQIHLKNHMKRHNRKNVISQDLEARPNNLLSRPEDFMAMALNNDNENLINGSKGHNNVTIGVMPFTCKYCQKSFKFKYQLQRHMRLHNVYQCGGCSRTFSELQSMMTHSKKHTGEKEFECRECRAKFTRKADLKRHGLVHVGNILHKCPVCSARFSMLQTFTRHLKVIHQRSSNVIN